MTTDYYGGLTTGQIFKDSLRLYKKQMIRLAFVFGIITIPLTIPVIAKEHHYWVEYLQAEDGQNADILDDIGTWERVNFIWQFQTDLAESEEFGWAYFLPSIASWLAFVGSVKLVSDIYIGAWRGMATVFRSLLPIAGTLVHVMILIELTLYIFQVIPFSASIISFITCFVIPLIVIERYKIFAAFRRSVEMATSRPIKVAIVLIMPYLVVLPILALYYLFIVYIIFQMLGCDHRLFYLFYEIMLTAGRAILFPIPAVFLVLIYYDIRADEKAKEGEGAPSSR